MCETVERRKVLMKLPMPPVVMEGYSCFLGLGLSRTQL